MSTATLTESVTAKVEELLARDGHRGFALRPVVSRVGCSGLHYQSKFDERAGELDHESRQFGVRIDRTLERGAEPLRHACAGQRGAHRSPTLPVEVSS